MIVIVEPGLQVVEQAGAGLVLGLLAVGPIRPVGFPAAGSGLPGWTDKHLWMAVFEREAAGEHGNDRRAPDGHPGHGVGHGGLAALRMPRAE